MGVWNECEDALLRLECNFKPYCPFCGSEKEFWEAKILNFEINDVTKEGNTAHAIDVEVVCPVCFHWETHGVAVSAGHYEEVVKEIQDIIEHRTGKNVDELLVESGRHARRASADL